MPWSRPASVPRGQVWLRFTGRELDGQPARRYQIRDLEDEHIEECIKILKAHFFRDEPLCKVLDLSSDPVSIEAAVSNWWRHNFGQNVSLACFTEVDGEPDELVAANILYVRTKDYKESKVPGVKYDKIASVIVASDQLVDVFKYFDVDEYLSSTGVLVLPGHRGQNIAARLFEAREPLCRAINIRATCSLFSSFGSQRSAEKCGYQLLATLHYAELIKQGIDLSGCEPDYAEVRGIKYIY